MHRVLKTVCAQAQGIKLSDGDREKLDSTVRCDRKRLFFKKENPEVTAKKDEPEIDKEIIMSRLAEISKNYVNR